MKLTAVLGLVALLSAPVAAQKIGVGAESRGRQREIKVGVEIGGPTLHQRGRKFGHFCDDGCRRWVPPRCETVTERVWIPPRCERVWVPPVYDEHCHGDGRVHRRIVRDGYWNTIHHPGRWECVTRHVNVPGRWENVCRHRR